MEYKQFDWTNLLEDLEYIFEGASIPFILLNETARRVKNVEDLKGIEVLEIGVLKKSMNEYVERTFRDRWGEWKDKNVEVTLAYSGQKMPVNIKFIKGKYSIFDNLDTVPYYGGMFKLPNPFEKYWKMRNLIK